MTDLLKQQMKIIDAVTGTEPKEETESRRKDNENRREDNDERRNYSHRSDRQKAHAAYGLKESDFC